MTGRHSSLPMTQPKPSSVVVAMSGGVDSSLAAALLKEQGREVHGVHLLLPACGDAREQKLRAVERVAEHLGIPLGVVDLREHFMERVIRPFVAGYLAGRTPNPCVVCNPEVKFSSLRAWADQHGAWFTATGHYARVRRLEGGRWALFRGLDSKKEQSYFLHRLGQQDLERALFPLGEFSKAETRSMAGSLGLPAASAPESQEICFLAGQDYRDFLSSRESAAVSRGGDIVDSSGLKLGGHRGVFRYTIGQRRGLGIASDRPYYVIALRPESGEVVVGRREDLFSRWVEAESFTWPSGRPNGGSLKAMAQVRYRHEASPGRLEMIAAGRVRFVFDEAQPAVTPGQALVCYDGDRVMGGGWITSAGKGLD